MSHPILLMHWRRVARDIGHVHLSNSSATACGIQLPQTTFPAQTVDRRCANCERARDRAMHAP